MADPFRWQAPGNGRLFDSSLEDWNSNKMSQRCIGVLEFLEENPLITKEEFEINIADYLEKKYGHEQNESLKSHFYRPLEFIGFMRYIDGLLSLSIDGKNFLNSMRDNDFDSALEYYVLQLFKTSYPNHATERNRLSLFPFRIMFKLLSKNSKYRGYVPRKFFLSEIPFIREYSDVELILEKLSDEEYLNHLSKYNKSEFKKISDKFYEKWNAWVVSSLVEMNILKESGNRNNSIIELASPINEFIEDIVDKMHFRDMFFASDKQYVDVKNKIRSKQRDPKLIQSVLENSNHTCFFDETHETFPSTTRPNYVEGHHIIPVSLNDSFEEELDCEENIIALCPNCHKAMHYATNEYKQKLLKNILNENDDFKKFDINLEDMKEIYFNKKINVKS